MVGWLVGVLHVYSKTLYLSIYKSYTVQQQKEAPRGLGVDVGRDYINQISKADAE